MAIENLIEQIERLQRSANDAIVKKETELSKKASIDQDVKELQEKCKQEFGCDIKELVYKKDQLESEINEKIKELNMVLNGE